MTASYPDIQLFIGGQWRDARDAKTFPVLNPATGMEIGQAAFAGIDDLDDALNWAAKGFTAWRRTTTAERQTVLRRAAHLIRERAKDIAMLMTLEQGKPLREAETEVLNSALFTEWFADEVLRRYGRIVPSRSMNVLQQVITEPIGPVAAFTPSNFPVSQVLRKLAAALAAGCSVLCKAPEETPASPAAMIQAFADAGVPAGAIGLVYGDPAQISEHLISSPIIRKLAYTGSTEVGKHLATLAGRHMKRATMELGGHSPVIIADDADVDLAVRVLGPSKLRNAGQVCVSPTRFLVHRRVKDEFTAGLIEHFESVRVGDGTDPAVNMGPLTSDRQVAAMVRLVKDARDRGAELLFGGEQVAGGGSFYSPTLLDEVPLQASVMTEEPFGPVVAMLTFDDIDEALTEANRLPYGLAAYAFTRSLKTMHEISHGIEAGLIWINQPATLVPEMPFGGVKDSGYGSEGGPEGIDAYSVVKSISTAMI